MFVKPSLIQKTRIQTVLLAQFPGLQTEILLKQIEIKISNKTKRIKYVYDISNNTRTLLFSLRTSDGRLLPSMEGARRIIKSGLNGNRIFVDDDAAPFVAEGKTAFCKHILKVDDNIFPNSEVFLLDKSGNLLAVGSSLQPGYAMLDLQAGPAVKIRHHKESSKK